MELNERQYERVARWLDGLAVELTEEERAAAEEIRRDAQAVGARLDVPVPQGVLERLNRCARRDRARVLPPRSILWRYAVESMAAAAVLVLTYMVALSQPPPKDAPRLAEVPMTADELFNEVLGPSKDLGISLLSNSVDELTNDVVMTEIPWSIEGQGSVDDLQQDVDDLLLDADLSG